MASTTSRGRTPIAVQNPATGEQIGVVPDLTAAEVRVLAEQGRAAQPGWHADGVDGRAQVLRRMQLWLLEHREEVIGAVQRETGRPYEESVLELGYVVTALGYWARHARRHLATERVPATCPFVVGKRLRLRYEPLGLVGIIAPWNFPVALGFGDAIPALAAGNSVLVKPSELTPLSISVIADGLAECGLPVGAFQIATGAGAAGAAVVGEVDMVMFTGSTATGRKVAAQAAERLIPVSLELGGKDATIVLADADLERAANIAVYGSMVNSGQVCLSTERVYVEAPVYEEFLDRVTEKVRALRQAVPGGPGTADIGAIISPAQVSVIERHVADAVAKGARVVTGGRSLGGEGQFFQPTVLTGVDHSMTCMRDETFGPLLSVMKVADAAEAVRLTNDSPYGLGATICTGNRRRGERIAARVEAGTVSINDIFAHFFAVGLPMGGLKASGLGARHGPEGIRKYCQRRTVLSSRWHLRRDVHMYPYRKISSRALLGVFRGLYAVAARIAVASRHV